MTPSRLRCPGSLLLLALLAAPRPAAAQAGLPCVREVDPCCAARPTYADISYSFTGDVLVGTREPEFGTGTNACVTIFDITQPYPGDGQNFAAVQRYHGPGNSWNVSNLGSVFGLTIDKFGNLYVCQTSCYGADYPGPGGDGAVYRIANGTGAITTFVTLPNSPGVGLGNITYDCAHDQFFVTDHEDGKIYRVKAVVPNAPTGTVLSSFDPLAADNGVTGFAPLGERLWGVQWHANRVYYSVWGQNCNETSGPPNSIRSVALDGTGDFDGSTDQLELTVPPHLPGYSMPVSDITFSPKGSMLLAERSMSGPSSPAAHESRLLEYVCNGSWAPAGPYVLGVAATCCCSGIAGNGTNSSGGVDCDFTGYTPATPFGRVWGTSDAINGSLTVYGIQGLPPGGGNPSNSAWVDFDGSIAYSEKTSLGDVEVPCADLATATTLSLFTVEPADRGLRVRWAFGESGDVSSVALERAGEEAGPWARIDAERTVANGTTVVTDRDVQAGSAYFYRLVVGTTSGDALTFGPVRGELATAIARFALVRTSPSPGQGPVHFEFAVPRDAHVRISVLDVLGREVEMIAEGNYHPGRFAATWNPGVAGGVYFVRMQTPAGNFQQRVVVAP